MSVAGPLVPRHPPAWPLTMAGAGDDGDDPALPFRRLISTHEADVEPIHRGELRFACEPCMLVFKSIDSEMAHHGNHPDMFVRMLFDPSCRHVFVECITMAQAEAIVRAYQGP